MSTHYAIKIEFKNLNNSISISDWCRFIYEDLEFASISYFKINSWGKSIQIGYNEHDEEEVVYRRIDEFLDGHMDDIEKIDWDGLDYYEPENLEEQRKKHRREMLKEKKKQIEYELSQFRNKTKEVSTNE